MSLFLRVLERITGKPIFRSMMTAAPGAGSLGELSFLARLTRWTFRQKPEVVRGKRVATLSTDDIDFSRPGHKPRIFPNYLERRRERRRAETKPSIVAVPNIDWRPD